MTTLRDAYDLVIIGGGPAGSAAAIEARRRKLSVLIIEGAAEPHSITCPGWIAPPAAEICHELGVDLNGAATATWSGLRIFSLDFTESTEVADPQLAGAIVESNTLANNLLAAADQTGADIITNTTVTRLTTGEDRVTLTLSNNHSVSASAAIVADGPGSTTSGLTPITTIPNSSIEFQCAQARIPRSNGHAGIDLVSGTNRALRLVTLVHGKSATRATLLSRDTGTNAVDQLAQVIQAGSRANILPPANGTEIYAIPAVAGTALEIESHVGKRCLLIGAAGGFAAALSSESLYPALVSGQIAAQTVADALAADVFQDQLTTFGNRWRAALADYLQMPNTDLGLLMPMVFKHEKMAQRIARAFLLGHSF